MRPKQSKDPTKKWWEVEAQVKGLKIGGVLPPAMFAVPLTFFATIIIAAIVMH